MCEDGQGDHRVEDLAPRASRRVFLLTSLSLLAGCATSSSRSVALPSPVWPDGAQPPRAPEAEPLVYDEAPRRAPKPGMGGVIPRSAWTREQPTYSLMNRQRPIRYITVHHDAHVSDITDRRAVARRLEAIRRYHRQDLDWGDIGYHFAVDRAGRVWETRPITWQGAHVKDHNEGNIGVMALGNFDEQAPTQVQVDALDRHVSLLMRTYKVPVSRVTTHREWAVTACPGRSLQHHMNEARSRRALG